MQVSDRNKNTRSIAVLAVVLLHFADYAYTTGFFWWELSILLIFLGSYCAECN